MYVSAQAPQSPRAYQFAPQVEPTAAEDSDAIWLLSFADLVTLLLTVFVLLFAFSRLPPGASSHVTSLTPPLTQIKSHPMKRHPAAATHASSVAVAHVTEPAAPKGATRHEPPARLSLPAIRDLRPKLVQTSAVPEPVLAQASVIPKPVRPHATATVPVPAPISIVPSRASTEPLLIVRAASRPRSSLAPPLYAWLSGTVTRESTPPPPTASTPVRTTADRHDVQAPPVHAVSIPIPSDLDGKVEVVRSATAVNLIITDDVLYPAGDAKLGPTGRALLDKIAAMLNKNDYAVSVKGYTDATPIHTARFPSNWELSTARATTVARYLISQGVAADRLSAIGYGATRPRAGNATPAERALNRRVSLVLHIRGAHDGRGDGHRDGRTGNVAHKHSAGRAPAATHGGAAG
ncbi:MAG: hypothetical protein B7Z66_12345 [Chromatiales bacterium 21-64-14]|nr:MAG: hypothetical protein B7Z66_12345 [Chromatiales bacterium 21-64-14]HQU16976.1 OmpA family protein [Gammaproteobacteria bacterium]